MGKGTFLGRLKFFADSYFKQPIGKRLSSCVASSHIATRFYSPNPPNMSNLLRIASRVEAAVAAYVSVQEFADTQQWKQKFRDEFVRVHLHGF
jgi:hypothetical protein